MNRSGFNYISLPQNIIVMKWYLARIVYQIQCGANEGLAQFEDQLRLIAATNEVEALNKTKLVGENEQTSLVNSQNQLVQWSFVNVVELYCISEFLDGAELFSAITEVSDAEGYINLVNDKSARLHQNPTRKQLNLI